MIAERLHEVEAEIEKARLRRTQVPSHEKS